MASNLFGFSLEPKANKPAAGVKSPVAPTEEDGVITISAGGYYGQYVDIDGISKNEFEMIRKYREVSLHPEVDAAIDEIVNEAIVSDLNDSPVEVELSNLKVSENIKNRIREELNEIKRLVKFDKKCYEIFRRWYIDGRLYYNKVIDLNNPSEGIKEIRYIDPLKIKKMREVKKPDRPGPAIVAGSPITADYGEVTEYYLFNPKGFFTSTSTVAGPADKQGIKMSKDSITFVGSGLMDLNQNIPLSYLHKSLKAVNQLRMIEDALVIYRLSRAPERRIFYIDVGNLPKIKAEQYLRETMARYRNKLVYDASTGEIKDDKKFMSMLEDFWLPRREGGRGTEITTLPGAQNLGELKDVEYFKKKLYKSLNLPPSRVNEEDTFSIGDTTEILRDELKFLKFIGRLRKKFSELFHDMLRTQLILKGVITPDDWETMQEHIQYDYMFDNHFSELKDIEIINQRVNVVNQLEMYVGTYYSREYVKRSILRMSDSQIKEMKEQIDAEKKSGEIPSTTQLDMLTEPPAPPTQKPPTSSSDSKPKAAPKPDSASGVGRKS
jgi:hypothetical protein